MSKENVLPEPIPNSFCGSRLNPCKKCGADVWESRGDRDNGDWSEEMFVCSHCGNTLHLELPD